MDYLFYFTTGLAIFVGLFYLYAKRKLSYWSKRGVKSVPSHLIFGNFKECVFLRKNPDDLLKEIYNSANPDDPYIGMYIFHKPALLLRDRNLIKQIMITDFETFPNRRFGGSNQRDTVGLDSILSMHQPRWKYLRRKLTPVVTGQKLRNMTPLMVKSSQEMIDFIESLPADKAGRKTYEPRDLSSRYLANLLSSVIFGIHSNSFNENDQGFLINGFFRKMLWSSMNAREKMGNQRGDLLDSLIALKAGEQNPLYKFEGDNLLAQASSLFMASFESGSTTIAFALWHLACHPEHQVTVYEEIQTHLAGEEWTMELINKMSFTESVLLEALKLFPPLPFTDRIAENDYKIPGTDLIIEKGTTMYLSINSTAQDLRFFSDPQKFDPSRKIEDKKFFEYLSFGIGPRACLAPRMALLFMKIALIAIVTNYTLHYETCKTNVLADKKKIHHVLSYPVDGLHVQFEKRDKSA